MSTALRALLCAAADLHLVRPPTPPTQLHPAGAVWPGLEQGTGTVAALRIPPRPYLHMWLCLLWPTLLLKLPRPGRHSARSQLKRLLGLQGVQEDHPPAFAANHSGPADVAGHLPAPQQQPGAPHAVLHALQRTLLLCGLRHAPPQPNHVLRSLQLCSNGCCCCRCTGRHLGPTAGDWKEVAAKSRPQLGSSAPAAGHQNVTFSAPQQKGAVVYGVKPGSNKVFTVQADQVGFVP